MTGHFEEDTFIFKRLLKSRLQKQYVAFQIRREAFKGCIRDVKILTQLNPEEVWKPLNWSSADVVTDAMPTWEGCPSDIEEGLHLYGSGPTPVLCQCAHMNKCTLLHLRACLCFFVTEYV